MKQLYSGAQNRTISRRAGQANRIIRLGNHPVVIPLHHPRRSLIYFQTSRLSSPTQTLLYYMKFSPILLFPTLLLEPESWLSVFYGRAQTEPIPYGQWSVKSYTARLLNLAYLTREDHCCALTHFC